MFSAEPIEIGQVLITPERLAIMSTVAIVVFMLMLFFQFTKLGKAMRATAQSQEAASLMGIRVPGIFSKTWALGTALGGTAGVLIAPLVGINTELGGVLVPGFVAAVVGGFTSIPGAIVGGVLVLVSLPEVLRPLAEYRELIFAIVLLLTLIYLPEGLAGAAERAWSRQRPARDPATEPGPEPKLVALETAHAPCGVGRYGPAVQPGQEQARRQHSAIMQAEGHACGPGDAVRVLLTIGGADLAHAVVQPCHNAARARGDRAHPQGPPRFARLRGLACGG